MSTVLVFEDSPVQRTHIANLFNSIGFQTLEARNGREALDKTHQYLPDLVISDIIAPHMNGYELCYALKSDRKTSHIPVIFCSAKEREDNGTPTLADAYITKPFQPSELIETAIAELLSRGKSWFHPSAADDWTEMGLMWLEDFNDCQRAIQAFSRALELEPNHDLAGKLKQLALGELEKSRHCEACRFYYGGSPGGNLLVCAVRPNGSVSDNCRDWESKYS